MTADFPPIGGASKLFVASEKVINQRGDGDIGHVTAAWQAVKGESRREGLAPVQANAP